MLHIYVYNVDITFTMLRLLCLTCLLHLVHCTLCPALLTKMPAAQNAVALSYHKMRGLYFLAVIFAATISP